MTVPEPCAPGRGRSLPPTAVAGVVAITVLLFLPLVVDVAERATATSSLALALTVFATAGALVVPLTGVPHRRWLTAAFLVMLLGVAVLTTRGLGAAWHNVWLLLSISVGATVGPQLATVGVALGGVLATTLTSGLLVATTGHNQARAWAVMLTVVLAGASNIVLVQLMAAIRELRITRGELARTAVVEERERFSRDLHDLLGHSLSVVVVKAEAVRRLVASDPAAAADHARDIETIGRRALTEVREAVDGYRRTSLATEISRGRAALESAGIDATVTTAGPTLLAEPVDEALAWVVREGITNVLRHSHAERCRLEIQLLDDSARLELVDDGRRAGPDDDPTRPPGSGLDGLRRRLAALDGHLATSHDADGFRLVATLPVTISKVRT